MKIVLCVAAVLCGASTAVTVTGPEQAAGLVYDELLSADHAGKAVYYLPQEVSTGQGIDSWHGTVASPFDGYLVLIDDMALANWEHPCRWIFVSFDGTLGIFDMNTPPNALERMALYRADLPSGVGAGDQSLMEWFTPNPRSGNAPENNYAWIISGGYNSSNNHIRYYGDVQFLYLTLTQDYGYDNDHIVICFADGLNPAVDNSSGQNSNPDLDGNGTADFDYDATVGGIYSAYTQLQSLAGADDHLFIFTTDHGGSGKSGLDLPPEAYLNLWNTQTWADDAYDTWINAFPTLSMNVAMEQCYSGGFLLETVPTTAGQPRTFASAANGYESSWAGTTYPQYDEWAYWWVGAMHGSVPAGGSYPGGALPGNPDLNSDGFVSYGEAADCALAWDAYAVSGQEHPQYAEDPAGSGDIYYLGGMITTGIEDESSLVGATGNLVCSANPVSGSALFGFDLAVDTEVVLSVMDLAGRSVSTIASGRMAPGHHDVAWQADVPTGVYIVRLSSPEATETLRVVKF